MKLATRRKLMPWLVVPTALALLTVTVTGHLWALHNLPVVWVLVSFAILLLLCVVSSIVIPPFWWGRAKFTTPMEDKSHIVEIRDDESNHRSAAG